MVVRLPRSDTDSPDPQQPELPGFLEGGEVEGEPEELPQEAGRGEVGGDLGWKRRLAGLGLRGVAFVGQEGEG